MTFKTRELTVDLVNEISTKEMSFYQGDENSVKLILNITNEGQELDLGQAKAVRITFNKSDGTTVFQEDCKPINALKGKYQIILKTQTLAAVGNVYAQVRIFIEDRKLDAEPFVFTVKQSYSGDTAVESKNEFTIIQRALEVGEQFKGVDFAPIIAAGALAQGALPKAGGTMTGNIDMDVAVGAKSKGLRWKDANGTIYGIESATTGELIMFDYKNGARVWEYFPTTRTYNMLASNMNVYKKTDLYPSWLNWNGYTFNLVAGTDLDTVVKSGIYGGSGLVSAPATIYMYIEVIAFHDIKYVLQRATSLAGGGATNQGTWVRRLENNVWGAWERLIDSKGGTFTGTVTVDKAQSIFFNDKTGVRKASIGVDSADRFFAWDEVGGRFFWLKNADGTFTVNADNLFKKTGDTVTGTFKMSPTSIITQEQAKANANAKGFFYTDVGSATTVAGIGRYVDETGADFLYMGHGSSPWGGGATGGLRVSPTQFTYKGKDIKTADKDGRATITVTADAELTSSDGVVADRRGNTVTLRARVRRKSELVNLIFTMPVDMRPLLNISHNITANDGTIGMLTIAPTSGEVRIASVGPALLNKDFNITFSYAVD